MRNKRRKKNSPPTTTLLFNLTRELIMMFTMSQLCRVRHCICESKSTRGDKHVHVSSDFRPWNHLMNVLNFSSAVRTQHTYASIPHYMNSSIRGKNAAIRCMGSIRLIYSHPKCAMCVKHSAFRVYANNRPYNTMGPSHFRISMRCQCVQTR